MNMCKTMNQLELEANTFSWRQARENAYDHAALRKWHEFFWPITELSAANPNKTGTTFDPRLETALTGYQIHLKHTVDIFFVNFCLPLSSGCLYLRDKFAKTTACSKLWSLVALSRSLDYRAFELRKWLSFRLGSQKRGRHDLPGDRYAGFHCLLLTRT